jgi:ribosome modulation factor
MVDDPSSANCGHRITKPNANHVMAKAACGYRWKRRWEMGWASGSKLATSLILSVESVMETDDGSRMRFYRDLIEAFEKMDCDTLNECLGMSEEFDRVYGERHPSKAGYRAAIGGLSRSACPYGRLSQKGKEWLSGFDEAQLDEKGVE